ncbi:hypothetical protein ALC60_09630, partial [Trachymyrmex zeteki]
IDNSFQLVKKLRGTQVDVNFSLISLDVVSLFTTEKRCVVFGMIDRFKNHRVEWNHDFDWENIQILDHERMLNKRLISEKAHILMQKMD